VNKLSLLFITISFITMSCAKNSSSNPSSPSTTPELAECITSTVYTSPVAVNGSANFFKRNLIVASTGVNVTSMTLGAPNATPIPIQFAEVRVLDANGTLVQCGQTNSSGSLKALDGTSTLYIPNTPGDYSFQVLARTNHIMTGLPGGKPSFKIYASVKGDVYANDVHAIAQTVTSSGVGTVTSALVAYARESESALISGGAFNIYNDIITTYNYLAQNTGVTNLACLNPKLDVFWRAGFNPAQYLYPSSDPSSLGTLSFYLRGYNQLFINGGRLGNVTSQDTDHFDDAVIIHELGHRIEDACGTMDSPGGTHYGLYRIDPRLAWSEGWGNFFGGHIIRNNTAAINPNLPANLTTTDGWLYYLDTKGYNEGSITSGTEYIRINLNKSGANPESFLVSGNVRYYDKVNSSTNPGEGHFREISIARSLFKSTNSCTATCTNCSACTNTNYFPYFWKAFENDSAGTGMGKASYPFRSSARFYNRLHQAFSGATPAAIDTILNSDEAQQRDTNAAYTVSGTKIWVPYGARLIPSITSCPIKIQPAPSLGLTTDSQADQRFSNHFYTIDLTALPGVSQIRINASYNSGSTHDIDLVLYSQSYQFTSDCTARNPAGDCTAVQKSAAADMLRADRSSGLAKQLSTINALDPAQFYLLNVRAFPTTIPAAASSDYSYVLTDQSGGFLCPASF
jgi:hypothetical protein